MHTLENFRSELKRVLEDKETRDTLNGKLATEKAALTLQLNETSQKLNEMRSTFQATSGVAMEVPTAQHF